MKAEEVYYETPLTKLLFQKADMKRIPLSGTFELSPVCNFNCRMCYVCQSQKQLQVHPRPMMTLEQWKDLADAAEKKRNAVFAVDRWGTVAMAGFLGLI